MDVGFDGVQATDKLELLVVRLFEQHQTAVFAYLYRLVEERELAHDLTQETFLRLFDTRERLPNIENQRAWIYRIATNLALTALKRRRRFAWLPWRKEESGLVMTDSTEPVAQRLLIEQTLSQLSPTYRIPLLLYSRDGFSVREIANVLQISEGAVKNRLYRARQAFRALFEEEVV
ncbi:MAG: RNA polymerase sigma factor [Chloroflexota bacterium]